MEKGSVSAFQGLVRIIRVYILIPSCKPSPLQSGLVLLQCPPRHPQQPLLSSLLPTTALGLAKAGVRGGHTSLLTSVDSSLLAQRLSRLADREAPRAVAAGRIRLGAVSVCLAAGAASCPLVPALSPFSWCSRSWAPPLLPSVRLELRPELGRNRLPAETPQDAAKSMGLVPL